MGARWSCGILLGTFSAHSSAFSGNKLHPMIFQQELENLRHAKWRIHAAAKERPLRTLDDAREFLNSVGFCLMYPVKPALVAPTFIGAYLSTKDNLPSPAQALLDARAKEAESLSLRLQHEKAAFEVGF